VGLPARNTQNHFQRVFSGRAGAFRLAEILLPLCAAWFLIDPSQGRSALAGAGGPAALGDEASPIKWYLLPVLGFLGLAASLRRGAPRGR